MRCVDCGRDRVPNEPGWLVVLPLPDEPPVLRCPACFAELLGGASADDVQDD